MSAAASTMEMTAVIKTISRSLGVAAAAALLAMCAYGAQAQEKKIDPPKATAKVEKKPPACKTILTQTTCEGRTDCNWAAEGKDKAGKVVKKASCRANPVAKTEPKKPEPKTK